jgi:very-short-patch-repair endonuclease
MGRVAPPLGRARKGFMVNSLSRKRLNRSVELAQRAHVHRVCPTHTEAKLWEALRGQQLGVTFRRQVPIGDRYIADFVAPSLRLIVEVDGGWHERRRVADARRDRELRRLGYIVLHLDAELVEQRYSVAVDAVRAAVAAVPAG